VTGMTGRIYGLDLIGLLSGRFEGRQIYGIRTQIEGVRTRIDDHLIRPGTKALVSTAATSRPRPVNASTGSTITSPRKTAARYPPPERQSPTSRFSAAIDSSATATSWHWPAPARKRAHVSAPRHNYARSLDRPTARGPVWVPKEWQWGLSVAAHRRPLWCLTMRGQPCRLRVGLFCSLLLWAWRPRWLHRPRLRTTVGVTTVEARW